MKERKFERKTYESLYNILGCYFQKKHEKDTILIIIGEVQRESTRDGLYKLSTTLVAYGSCYLPHHWVLFIKDILHL